jgi:hypothetical protein
MELLYTPEVKINCTKAEREGGFEKIGLFFFKHGKLPTNLHVV